MAIDLLLLFVGWQGMALENMDLPLLCHPSDMKVGFQILMCTESVLITWKMATGVETSLIGHPHPRWTGIIIEIVVEMDSPMKGKVLRGDHCHPLLPLWHHFLPIVTMVAVVVDGLGT